MAGDQAIAMLSGLEGDIMGLPGRMRFICSIDAEGNGDIAALVESEERSNANTPKVKEIWAKFFEMLETPPEPKAHPVVTHRDG